MTTPQTDTQNEKQQMTESQEMIKARMMLDSKDQKNRIAPAKGVGLAVAGLEGEENLLQADAVANKPDDGAGDGSQQKVYEDDVDINSPRAQTANSKQMDKLDQEENERIIQSR